MSGKIDFKIKTVIRDKEGYKIMIKGSFQEDIYIYINCKYTCTQYRNTSIYKVDILVNIKGDTKSNTVIVGNFNTPFISMDRSSREAVRKHRP